MLVNSERASKELRSVTRNARETTRNTLKHRVFLFLAPHSALMSLRRSFRPPISLNHSMMTLTSLLSPSLLNGPDFELYGWVVLAARLACLPKSHDQSNVKRPLQTEISPPSLVS